MSELKIGDRVRVVSESTVVKPTGAKSIIGMTGTVKCLSDINAGVEFDDYMGGHNGSWNGKNGYCWYIPYERLEKIEDTEEETKAETKEENEEIKADTLEQKILEVLREEIGVNIGEEFELCRHGEKSWTCKFEKNGFFCKTDGDFYKSEVWKDIIGNFYEYSFKRKPFIPQEYENYWHVDIRHSGNLDESLDVTESVWVGILFDYGMLALGNVFRTREEAIKSEDKLLERLNELLKDE